MRSMRMGFAEAGLASGIMVRSKAKVCDRISTCEEKRLVRDI